MSRPVMNRRFNGGRLLLMLAIGGLVAGCGTMPDGATSDDGGLGMTGAACTADSVRTGRRLKRLTRFEFDNTVADLFHIQSTWGQSLPPDDVVDGFDNNGAALRVGALLADKLLTASEAIAEAATKDMAALSPCAAGASPDAACARTLIGALGRRAFRRPITQVEQERYLALHSKIAQAEGFAEGVKVVISALVQSPHFLYRAELGAEPSAGLVALTDHEIASELSYLLWGSMPDDALLAAADAGSLHTAEAITAQARRLLASPRSRPLLDHFATQWLALDTLQRVSKDGKYQDFTPLIRAAMVRETLDLFDHVVRGGGKLPSLLVTNESYLAPELATFYGVSGAPLETLADGTARFDVSAAHRGGLLTHGSILASQAKPDSASPVHRGKLVREKLLCGYLAPPPAGLNLQLAPVDPNASNRERFTMHSSNPTCASCHSLIDKIGFGFERFDAVGRYQQSDNGHAIDDTGEIVGSRFTNGEFHGVLELESRLAASDDLSACFALQWVTFGYGIEESRETACLVERATSALRGSGLRIDELLVALTQAPDFTHRLAEAGQGGGPDMSIGPLVDGGAPSNDLSPVPDLSAEPLLVAVHEDSRWAAGYCSGVMVTNRGAAPIEWKVALHVEGKINNLWNAAQKSAGGDLIEFSGLDYNHTLAPGATLTFGWCAAL